MHFEDKASNLMIVNFSCYTEGNCMADLEEVANLCLDLRKAGFHAHNSKTYFSPSHDSSHPIGVLVVLAMPVKLS